MLARRDPNAQKEQQTDSAAPGINVCRVLRCAVNAVKISMPRACKDVPSLAAAK
jgi:hypothetical protein